MGIFEQEDILYDVKESDLDTNLNLDVSVVSEKSDYSTSSLDKIGIKVFSDEADEIINAYNVRKAKEYAYYKENIFLSNQSADERIINTIKSKVFLVEPVRWEYKEVYDNKESNTPYIYALWVAICLLVSVIMYRVQTGERKKKVADSKYSDA